MVGTNELLTIHFGPHEVLVTPSLAFADKLTATAVQDAVNRIERRIRTAHPEVSRVFVEAQSLLAHQKQPLVRRPRPADDLLPSRV